MLIVALVLLTPLLTLSVANAENRSPFDIDLRIDIPVATLPIIAVGIPFIMADDLISPRCLPFCDPNSVNTFDRRVIGNDNSAAKTASDALFLTSLLLPHALGAADVLRNDPSDGWRGYGKDEMVLLQTLTLTLAFNSALGFAVQRGRPSVYADPSGDHKGDDALSFPSGHTSASFAMATAYSFIYMKRHPKSKMVIPMWIGSYALATTIAVLRTEAGRHFPTDVIAGAALGIGMGLLVPWLHLSDDDDRLSSHSRRRRRWALLPMARPGAIGAMIMIR